MCEFFSGVITVYYLL